MKNRFLILFWIAILATGISLYKEFLLGDNPCFLCWVQRGVYLLLIIISLLGLMTRWSALIRKVCLVVLSLGFCVSVYHTLVLLHFVKDRCKAEIKITDANSFKNLLHKKAIGCAENSSKIGPVPLSAANGAVLLVLFLIILKKK